MQIKGRRVVGGVGPRNPKLIVVGESLGEQEEIQGIPFVGTDGHILDGMLNSAGILRSECYITNVVKVRPPQNKVKRLYEYGLSGGDFLSMLKEELDGITCKVIVPLGNVALGALCGIGLPKSGDILFTDGIGKWRGSILPSTFLEGRTCIPSYNPGFVREMWQSRGTVVQDFKKALRVAKGGREVVSFNTITRPSIGEVEWFLSQVERECDRFVFDIESYKVSKQISCVGVGATLGGKRVSLCIPLKKGYLNYWDREDELWVWERLRKLFQNEGLLKIGQFINFDFTMLGRFLGEAAPPWYDINIAHHTVDPELPHDLAYMTSIYTDVPYYKDDTKAEGVDSWTPLTPTERLWEYNGKDCEVPLIIEERLTREMKEEGVWEFFCGFAMPKMRALWRVQCRGMEVDQKRRDILTRWQMRKVGRKQRELNETVGETLNVQSPKQIQHFLYNILKLPVQYHKKTKKVTSDKGVLEKLYAKYPNNQSFKLVMELRSMYKEIGTYLTAPISQDGRCRTTYNSTGTETGRSSSSKTVFGDGMDLQNVPEYLRGMFVAGKGKVFLKYDLWQAEAYVVSVLAQCRAFLDRLERGVKIYPLVAGWLFGCEEGEVNVKDNNPGGMYGRAKRVVHGGNYGLGPGTMATFLQQTQSQAKAHLQKYFSHAPEILQWHYEVQEELKLTRKLVTPFGRVRYFRNRLGDDMYREAYAHIPQSTIGEYLHQALMRFEYSYLPHARVVQEGFDSIVVECEEGMVEEVDARVRGCFEKDLWWKGRVFRIPVDGERGMAWGK